ncbi:cellulose biosynthesis cyclic di-GMP-binding regulatory protein BcsB [Bacillus shivajii]|uniref:cellulose biosynthesis cyclic di-GMP-binding regulatory protein BcsB n=1 Tax=Bacillus shivajii TaxID=1983719 RepID=UPI001CFA005A|nr:cellulose biosynthesis cyclic di-GMP-binding regulatory protein BcsB [Bacillus shivajii]UCZ53579.1 cellulose biosynthesis cyclic di-GMP-binding regulatory protein BcsB [Bacillus shivajii]
MGKRNHDLYSNGLLNRKDRIARSKKRGYRPYRKRIKTIIKGLYTFSLFSILIFLSGATPHFVTTMDSENEVEITYQNNEDINEIRNENSVMLTEDSFDETSIERFSTHLENWSALSQRGETREHGQITSFVADDVKMVGPSQVDMYYEAPLLKKGDDHYIYLTFSHSPLLLPETSTLTVEVNNQPVHSMFLTSETANHSSLKIKLDESMVTEGFHKVTLLFQGYITDDLCQRAVDPSNWLVVHSNSFVHLDVGDFVQQTDLLKHYPYPFIQPGYTEPLQFYLVVPDHPSEPIISAATQLAHFLRSQVHTSDYAVIITESETSAIDDLKNIIAVGRYDDWNGIIKETLTTRNLDIGRNYVTIDTFILDEINKQFLFFGGDENDLIEKKIPLLTEQHVIKQLAGSSLSVAQLPETIDDNEDMTFDLKSKGMEDLHLNSRFNTSPVIRFDLPLYGEIEEHPTLHVNMRISPLLHELVDEGVDEHLGINIYINEKPYTIPLRRAVALVNERNELTYEVPIDIEDINASKYIEVIFSTNLVSQEVDCIQRDDSTRWIEIENSSFFDFSLVESSEINFSNWPAPFVNAHGLQDTTFILPDKLNGQMLSQLAQLTSSMVPHKENIRNLNIVYERNVEDVTSHFINDHIISLHEKLWDTNENTLSSSPFLLETLQYIALIEPSLWNEEKAMATFQPFITPRKDQPFFDPEMLVTLQENDKRTTTIGMSQSGNVILDEKQLSVVTPTVPTTEEPALPWWISLLFIIIFLFSIFLFVLLLKKKRTNED